MIECSLSRSNKTSLYDTFRKPVTALAMKVYCVLIAQFLMIVIHKKTATNMITAIRLLFNEICRDVGLYKDTYKAWRKTHNASFDSLPSRILWRPHFF